MVIGGGLRFTVWLTCPPGEPPDTWSYVRLAKCIRTLECATFDGQRTPGYPVFMLAGAMNFRAIMLMQHTLGMMTALIVLALTWRATGSWWIAGVVGLAHALRIDLLSYETNMLSEALSAFLTVLSVAMVAQLLKARSRRLVVWVALALLHTAAVLTRPLLVVIPIVSAVWIALRMTRGWAQKGEWLRFGGGYIAPIAISLLAWCLVNQAATGAFGLTTLLGYNLSNHSGGFIEFAGDEYAAIRDPYLRARPPVSSHTMTIWRVEDDIRAAQRWTMADLSRRLTRMSLTLFAQQPRRYARSVCRAWAGFWGLWSPLWGYSIAERVHAAWLGSVLRAGERVTDAFGVIGSVLFLLCGGYLIFDTLAGSPPQHERDLRLLSVAVVGLASVVQALLELGENWRYSLPFQPLVWYVVAVGVWEWVQARRVEARPQIDGAA
jgi:hypothetical protein